MLCVNSASPARFAHALVLALKSEPKESVAHDPHQRIAELEAKLEDTVELLHMWKDEAFTYRFLVEALLAGEYSVAKAREILNTKLGMLQRNSG